MSSKVYISCPVSISERILTEASAMLNHYGIINFNWKRGTKYTSDLLEISDAVAIILPNNTFKMYHDNLSSGCYKEIKQALNLNKPIYLLYKTREGTMKIYTIDLLSLKNHGIIEGVAGSTKNALGQLTSRVVADPSVVNPYITSEDLLMFPEIPENCIKYDLRLLLK